MEFNKKLSLKKSPAWQALAEHHNEFASTNIKNLFKKDSDRFEKFSLFLNDILLDYSKNLVSDETMKLLFDLAYQEKLTEKIKSMFNGETINFTEKRSVLHIALRNRSKKPIFVDGESVVPKVEAVLAKMEQFVSDVHHGIIRGHTGKKFTDIVNLGIGGSDLGPHMVTEALKPYAVEDINVHFVSNVDSTHVIEVINRIDPETTLFLISSKTFTTQETLTNAHTARRWIIENLREHDAVSSHFIAISTNTEKVTEFGIDKDRIFEFWDWVGGRFSLWSAIGLPIALYLGMDRFYELLDGAYEMDRHFATAPLEENMPVIMALLGIWYSSFMGAQSYAILPYDQYLHRFTAYLQQAEMESNGKRIDIDGNVVDYQTAPVIWGESGTNGQHAFYQLIHQGTKLIPIDFMAPIESHNPVGDHHEILLSNFFAQSEALMMGRNESEVRQALAKNGITGIEAESLVPHMIMPGNKPSNSILFNQLTPHTLGSLIALYEHKIFTQGAIWRINSFDQWGVELGKILAQAIQPELEDDLPVSSHDESTNGLINYYKNNRLV